MRVGRSAAEVDPLTITRRLLQRQLECAIAGAYNGVNERPRVRHKSFVIEGGRATGHRLDSRAGAAHAKRVERPILWVLDKLVADTRDGHALDLRESRNSDKQLQDTVRALVVALKFSSNSSLSRASSSSTDSTLPAWYPVDVDNPAS